MAATDGDALKRESAQFRPGNVERFGGALVKGAQRAFGARRDFKDRPKKAVQRSGLIDLKVRRPEARAGKRLCDSWHSDEPPCSNLEGPKARRGLGRGQGTEFTLWLVAIDGGGLATPGIVLRIWPGAVRPGERVLPIQRAAADPRDIRSRSRHWRGIPPCERSRRLRNPPVRRGKIIGLAGACLEHDGRLNRYPLQAVVL